MKKKICMVGLYGVGKTSMVRRFVESAFDDRYLTTVGVKIDKKEIVADGKAVTLALWDIAGEDELAEFRASSVRGASGYILVADGLRDASLDKAIELQQRISGLFGALPFVLVVNKADLRDEWEIRRERIAALADEGWTALEASAKTGAGVEEAFLQLTRAILARDSVRTAIDEEE